ncbi:MAG: hypothetical protein SFV18_01060 [Bryobacteraceae bacterium]|nr:hypothetical protein [Bryobacteraceae bacterium]
MPSYEYRQLVPQRSEKAVNKPFADLFHSLTPDRSLLAHDCRLGWCDQKELQLPAILSRAGAVVHYPGSGAEGWAKAASQVLELKHALKSKFQPLAVVNRLDLGHWDGTQVRDAELRFVYGPQGGANLTVIVEFVFKPMSWEQFRNFAYDWRRLSLKECDADKFGGCVATLTRWQLAKSFDLVRVRVNFDLNNDKRWSMAQWVFQNAELKRTKLDDQMSPTCMDPNCQQILEAWKAATAQGARRAPMTATEELASYNLLLEPGGKLPSVGMAQPAKACGPGAVRARNILSLQQCTHCHSGETNTKFTHISNRGPGQTAATLSEFLVGNEMAASLDSLSSGTAAYVAQVKVWRSEPKPGGGCTVPASKPIERRFHDLGRRRLFLASVLVADRVWPSKTTLYWMDQYAPDFSH